MTQALPGLIGVRRATRGEPTLVPALSRALLSIHSYLCQLKPCNRPIPPNPPTTAESQEDWLEAARIYRDLAPSLRSTPMVDLCGGVLERCWTPCHGRCCHPLAAIYPSCPYGWPTAPKAKNPAMIWEHAECALADAWLIACIANHRWMAPEDFGVAAVLVLGAYAVPFAAQMRRGEYNQSTMIAVTALLLHHWTPELWPGEPYEALLDAGFRMTSQVVSDPARGLTDTEAVGLWHDWLSKVSSLLPSDRRSPVPVVEQATAEALRALRRVATRPTVLARQNAGVEEYLLTRLCAAGLVLERVSEIGRTKRPRRKPGRGQEKAKSRVTLEDATRPVRLRKAAEHRALKDIKGEADDGRGEKAYPEWASKTPERRSHGAHKPGYSSVRDAEEVSVHSSRAAEWAEAAGYKGTEFAHLDPEGSDASAELLSDGDDPGEAYNNRDPQRMTRIMGDDPTRGLRQRCLDGTWLADREGAAVSIGELLELRQPCMDKTDRRILEMKLAPEAPAWKQIAGECGLSEIAAKRRYARILQRLREPPTRKTEKKSFCRYTTRPVLTASIYRRGRRSAAETRGAGMGICGLCKQWMDRGEGESFLNGQNPSEEDFQCWECTAWEYRVVNSPANVRTYRTRI